jgi:hypothetical protein
MLDGRQRGYAVRFAGPMSTVTASPSREQVKEAGSLCPLFHDPELTRTSTETLYGLTSQWLDRWLPQR